MSYATREGGLRGPATRLRGHRVEFSATTDCRAYRRGRARQPEYLLQVPAERRSPAISPWGGGESLTRSLGDGELDLISLGVREEVGILPHSPGG